MTDRSREYETVVIQDERSSATGLEVPFDPVEAFGKVRAPVAVTISGHTYRTTVFRMSGACFVPLNKANREAAGVEAGDTVTVTMALDTAERTIEPPRVLAGELAADAGLRAVWDGWSFTRRREAAESIAEAKRAETKARRLQKVLGALRSDGS